MMTLGQLENLKEMWQDDWSPDLRKLVRDAGILLVENARLRKKLAKITGALR